MSPPSDQVVEDFLAGLTASTRTAYRRDLTCVMTFLHSRDVTLLEAGRRDLQHYVARCHDSGLAPRTIARRLAALSGLYRHACAEGLLPASPVTLLRRPRLPTHQVRRGLDPGEARLLLHAAADHSTRAEALVSLLLGTGLRVSAICTASVTDVTVGTQLTTLTYRNKGGGTAQTVLTTPVRQALARHLDGRTHGPLLDTCGPVGRLDRTGAHRLLKQVAAIALPGRTDVSPHTLRSTFAQLALQAGSSLTEVSLALAHAHVASTQPYLAAVIRLEAHPAHAVAAVLRPPEP